MKRKHQMLRRMRALSMLVSLRITHRKMRMMKMIRHQTIKLVLTGATFHGEDPKDILSLRIQRIH